MTRFTRPRRHARPDGPAHAGRPGRGAGNRPDYAWRTRREHGHRSRRVHPRAGGRDDAGGPAMGNPSACCTAGQARRWPRRWGRSTVRWSAAAKHRLGIELSCTHHRAANEGMVTAVSVPLHVGRTLCTFEIVVSDNPTADLHRTPHGSTAGHVTGSAASRS